MQGADLYTQFSFKNIEIANGVHIGLQGKALKRDWKMIQGNEKFLIIENDSIQLQEKFDANPKAEYSTL